MSYIGLILIFASILLLSRESEFPGLTAIPVCLGSAFLLLAGEARRGVVFRLLSGSASVYVGRISYALYLWHWPVLAFYRSYHQSVNIPWLDGLCLVALTFLLSHVTLRFVENPVRFSNSPTQVKPLIVGLFFLAVAISGMVVAKKGFSERIPESSKYAASMDVMWQWPCEKEEISDLGRVCTFGREWKAAKHRIILWGDSHAMHLAPLLEHASVNKDVAFLLWSCPVFIDNENVRRWYKRGTGFSERCGGRYKKMMAWLSERNDINAVFVASAWIGYPESLFSEDSEDRNLELGLSLIDRGVSRFLNTVTPHHSVVIFSDVPRPDRELIGCAHSDFRGISNSLDCDPLLRKDIEEKHQRTNAILTALSSNYMGVTFVDMLDRLCSGVECPIFLEGKLIYRDGNHYRRNWSRRELALLEEKVGFSTLLDSVLMEAKQ